MAFLPSAYSRAAQQNGRSQTAKIDARAVPGKWETFHVADAIIRIRIASEVS